MGAELSRNLFGDLGKDTLEQLDLLLMQEVRARKVRRDGIHFQGLHLLQLLENEVPPWLSHIPNLKSLHTLPSPSLSCLFFSTQKHCQAPDPLNP